MPLTDPGPLHRLAVVVPDLDEATSFFVDVLGGQSLAGMLDGSDPARREEMIASEGADMRLVWLGDIPVILIGPSGHELGLAEKFLKRTGPGVHSLAWEITDMWALEHRLRDRDIGITGVSVEGRHFFMHPRDTHGLLIEWCDGPMGAPPAPTGTGVVSVESLAWVSGVVADAEETAAFLGELAVVKPTSGPAAGSAEQERTVDLEIGPITVRLVTPTSPESRYSPMIDRGGRWGNAAFRVADLDATLDALAGAGIATIERDGSHAVTDPASTLGVTFEWAS